MRRVPQLVEAAVDVVLGVEEVGLILSRRP